MNIKLFSYHLPKELIAQKPAEPRDRSRLMVLDRQKKTIKHDWFYNLPKYLSANDVLVFNDTKVFPARLVLNKQTGGRMEILLLKEIKNGQWQALVSGKKRKAGFVLTLKTPRPRLKCALLKKMPDHWLVKFNLTGQKFKNILARYGEPPLPPYIKTRGSGLSKTKLKKAYQTIYAQPVGSVAAPTAGLHFTENVLKKINRTGTKNLFLTLHVGQGTFQPVREELVENHKMHAEWARLDQKTALALNQAKKTHQRIIAVGTTTTRVLETATDKNGTIKSLNKDINTFIYPGYKFKTVQALLTNFHLPQSTLLMLVSAFAGRPLILKAYQEAIKKKYRFYSFGDAMLIL